MHDELFERRIQRHLEPEVVLANLTRVGVALTLYELLRAEVFKVVDFMGHGQKRFENSGITHKSGFKECVPWLEGVKAITADDAATIYEVRDYRNQLAHESTSLVIDPSVEVRDAPIDQGGVVLHKLALYWARLWISLDAAFDGQEIRDDEIGLPAVSLFQHIVATTRSANPE